MKKLLSCFVAMFVWLVPHSQHFHPTGKSPGLNDPIKRSSISDYSLSILSSVRGMNEIGAASIFKTYVTKNTPRVFFYPHIKYLITAISIRDDQRQLENRKRLKVERITLNDTVLKGGVWRGAVVGALLGMAAAGFLIATLNEDDWLSPTHDQRVLMVAWGGFNGAGLGGFIGFGRQRKKQRQLNRL